MAADDPKAQIMPVRRGRGKKVIVGPSSAKTRSDLDSAEVAAPFSSAEANAPLAVDDPSNKMQGGFLIAVATGCLAAAAGLLPNAQWVGFGGPLITIIAY